jgi:hypothetical protein
MRKTTHLTIAIAAALFIIMLIDLYSLKQNQQSAGTTNVNSKTIGFQQQNKQ